MTEYRITERDEDRDKPLVPRVTELLSRNWPFATHSDYREWFGQVAMHVVDIVSEQTLLRSGLPSGKRRVGCVVCWMHPDIKGEDVKDVNVIYDGNGYCGPHWVEASKYIAGRSARVGNPVQLPVSVSLPMLLAGWATEAP